MLRIQRPGFALTSALSHKQVGSFTDIASLGASNFTATQTEPMRPDQFVKPGEQDATPPHAHTVPMGAQAAGEGSIILIRHGQPYIDLAPHTSRHGFATYIEDYERAGLSPGCLPPPALKELLRGHRSVFTSDRPRALDSARIILPDAELIADPLFVEAPLAAPVLPLIRMNVQAWAVLARLCWHLGHHPKIEAYKHARQRARDAATILRTSARKDGMAVLVAHGYFNFMIGRELKRLGYKAKGRHRPHYWNAVHYEKIP